MVPPGCVSVARISAFVRPRDSVSRSARRRVLHRQPASRRLMRAGLIMPDIRILMVDDHGLFRESLGRLLDTAPHIQVVGQCATVAEALASITRDTPDVILLDYDLGEESGLSLLTELRRRSSEARVLMVTAELPAAVTLRVMEDGASGIFLKHSNPDQLIAAIQEVASAGNCL